MLPTAPEQARQASRAIQDAGRTVLADLQWLLGVLRSDEDESPRSPREGLAQLDALIADVRSAGLPVELRVEGERVALGAGIDVSAYRVVQEGLTNALKHAGPVDTAVTVRYQPDTLTMEILNAGAGAGAGSDESGHSLVGMRERVALYGGDLHAGPQPSGGYAVRARLPLGSNGA